MHLLATVPGALPQGAAVDLALPPGEILVLTSADSEIALLAAAQRRRLAMEPAAPALRLASLLRLQHNLSVDLLVEKTVRHARIVILRLLGGRGYWPYGVDEIAAACRAAKIPVAFLPGDEKPDAELDALSSVAQPDFARLWRYLSEGGPNNAEAFLAQAAQLIGRGAPAPAPAVLPRAGFYWPGLRAADAGEILRQSPAGAPIAALLFYRALALSGNLRVIDALIAALQAEGLAPLPIFLSSLKDTGVWLADCFGATKPDVVLAGLGFAANAPGEGADARIGGADCAALQLVFAGSTRAQWEASNAGLEPRDLAMNVALPEIDGRVLAAAVSFKSEAVPDPLTGAEVVDYAPEPERIAAAARLAAAQVKLKCTRPIHRRIAIVLANYPARDGRLANGVGLDTPAAGSEILRALANAGYRVEDSPADGDALLRTLAHGPTNAQAKGREIRERLKRDAYDAFFASLPAEVQSAVTARWGAPDTDHYYVTTENAFAIPALRLGNIVIALQPARGGGLDPDLIAHDPALVPPHGYLALHAWLRHAFDAHAVVHLGKHGTLEWLPGKAIALSERCFPEALLGPLPNFYPFIVNDPGEGSQAKRRTHAVIVDHLTPPLARAGSTPALATLESLLDELAEAQRLDPRRIAPLHRALIAAMADARIEGELGLPAAAPAGVRIARLDAYLCELKELQIRGGLHVFGQSPRGAARDELLLALARTPGPNAQSLQRALAEDLGLGFDPLDCALGDTWAGPRPAALSGPAPWRTTGDTVERIEALALALIAGTHAAESGWTRTRAALDHLLTHVAPALDDCGARELAGLLAGLDGRFVEPGPAGAPTRGRPDVLPTGRNFHALDPRAMPTRAAWELGFRSAQLMVERHAQDHGSYPQAIALSAWGTSNMRTGGEDIAQALALLGARPLWDASSGRVSGFELLPLGALGRPRVDVTLRVSGFFRDAFRHLIELFDAAVRLVAAQKDEKPEDNPLAARVRTERATLTAGGLSPEDAAAQAQWRVFSAPPGGYGAGLGALIDGGGWRDRSALADAFLSVGGYAYAAGAYGVAARGAFETRLKNTTAVAHNQDNREHDLLDSDDYYQFEGGLAAAIETLSGRAPVVYHNDHSRPEAPKVRVLAEEIARVVRARAVNPKWIAGMMRHGYKGAFEMAATVDYLFAFAATTEAVASYQFDLLYDAYLGDPMVEAFIAEHNPAILREMAERFLEAEERGMWHPRANSAAPKLSALAQRETT